MSLNCRPLQDLNPKYKYTPHGVFCDDWAAREQAPLAIAAHSDAEKPPLDWNASDDLVPA